MRVRLNQQRLIEILSQSRLTQNHWAIKLGLSRGHLSDLANGKHPYPSPKTREKLLEGFGVPFEELFQVETGSEWTHASSATFQAQLADRYLIDEEVGQGGMGTVYLARDVRHGRRVALKVISPEAVSGVGTEQFLKEIRKTAQLEHPHILTLLDSGEAAGYPYYVMPYVREGSLRDLLKRKHRLSLEETTYITRGVAAALRHAHANHVVHCDIKPENILIADGHAYLADFGIARAVHAEVRGWKRRGEIDSSAGTPAYVSPEQASGEEMLDGKSDVYSLGCVVFEMLSGKPPFAGTTTMEIVTKRFTGTVPDLRRATNVPGRVAGVVAKAMAVDATKRYATAGQFHHALGEATARGRRPVVEAASLGAARLGAVVKRMARALGGGKGNGFMHTVVQDLTYTLRSLKRRPAQTAVLLLTLALGIGVNSAMFSVVSAVLLRPLPYPEPQQLTQLWESRRGEPRSISVTYPNFVDMRDQAEAFGDVAAYYGGSRPVTGGSDPLRVPTYTVSESFFDVLGVTPRLGGTFVPEAVSATGPVNAVVSDAFWRSYFGADPDVLGARLSISGRPATVVGVMPPGFAFPRGAAMWLPMDLAPDFGPSRTAHNLSVVARLRNGVTLQAGQAEMTGLASRLATAYADEIDADFDIAVVPLHDQLAGQARDTLVLLLTVVGVVLVIACGNIASILLSQSVARHKEIAIRRAIGAGAPRLMRQMLTESAFIGVLGAVAGLGLSVWSMSLLNAVVPAQYLHSGDVALDWRVVAFALVLGLVTGLLFGLLPARSSAGRHPADALRADGAEVTLGARRRRIGGLFVIPQYAFSLAALVAAGLILKSLFVLSNVDPGFATEGRLSVTISLPFDPPSPYADRERAADFYRTLLERLESLPGVRSATVDFTPPLSASFYLNGGVKRAEEDPEGRWDMFTDWRPVGAGYFATMGIPIVQGRDFDENDDEDGLPVAIVNQSLARRLWGGDDPIGKRLRLSSLDNNRAEARRPLTVVGVVPDVHHRSLDQPPRSAAYAPAFQHLDRVRGVEPILAVDRPAESYAGPIRDIVRSIDADIPVGRIESLEGWARESIAAPRFRAGLLSAFGALALLLALLGVYGVMSYSVTQRRREMAVRIALGAERRDILRMLTGEGLRFVVAGQLLGLGAAYFVTRLMDGLLFGVDAMDAAVFAGTSAGLAVVVLVTSYVPARRAGLVAPVEVLKE